MSAGRKKNECRNERYPIGVESESHGRAEIRTGKRFTRWSRNELQAVIADAVRLAQQDDSPIEQTNVYPLRRETKPKAFSRAELDELKNVVKTK